LSRLSIFVSLHLLETNAFSLQKPSLEPRSFLDAGGKDDVSHTRIVVGQHAFTSSSGNRRNRVLFSTQVARCCHMSSSASHWRKNVGGGTLLLEPAMIRNIAPILPQDLIAKAKYALKKSSGVLEQALWADDFEFCTRLLWAAIGEFGAAGFNSMTPFRAYESVL
jgi:hypothetical protein